MFPEIRAALAEAFEAAPDGAVYCVGRYRGSENLRTQFARILERAGVIPWPKPFINLRSTRRTELQERFPDHVVNGWLGHSGAVAAKHYLQTTDEHWQRATDPGVPIAAEDAQNPRGKADSGVPTGVPIDANHGPSVPVTETKKPRENPRFDCLRCLPDGQTMTPTGSEHPQKSRGKTASGGVVYPPVYPSGAITADTAELLAIFEGLDPGGRADLLAVARGLCALANNGSGKV
jgi:hypothetical protein